MVVARKSIMQPGGVSAAAQPTGSSGAAAVEKFHWTVVDEVPFFASTPPRGFRHLHGFRHLDRFRYLYGFRDFFDVPEAV